MTEHIRSLIVQAFTDGRPPQVLYRGKGPAGDVVMLDFGEKGGVQQVDAATYDRAIDAGKLAADAHPEYRLLTSSGVRVEERMPLDFYDRSPSQVRVPVDCLSVVRNGRVIYSTSVKQGGSEAQTISALLHAINSDMKLK